MDTAKKAVSLPSTAFLFFSRVYFFESKAKSKTLRGQINGFWGGC